jgi:hypothetical protein
VADIRLAIIQDRATADLARLIGPAWETLRSEWRS